MRKMRKQSRAKQYVTWIVASAAIAGATLAYGARGSQKSRRVRAAIARSAAERQGTDAGVAGGKLAQLGKVAAKLGARPLRKTTAAAMTLTGIVLDPQGVPAAGVTVDGGALEGDLEEQPSSVVTDSDGRFALPVVLAYGGSASGMLSARAPGSLRGAVNVYVNLPGTTEDVELRLSVARTIEGVARVAGTPTPGIKVSAMRIGSMQLGDAEQVSATTGAGGRYVLEVPSAGVYRVEASLSATRGAADYVQVLDQERAAQADLDLPAMRMLALDVVDDTGAPIPFVRVISNGSREPIAVTDRNGKSQLGLPEGGSEYLTFEREGFAAATQYTKSAEPTVRQVLQRVPTIVGQVEAPQDGVTRIWVRRPVTPEGKYSQYATLMPVATLHGPGTFRADVMEPGSFEVVAYVEGVGESTRRTVETHAGETSNVGTLSVGFDRGSAAGVVVGKAGAPVAGLSVRLSRSEMGAANLNATTDAAGRFQFANVPMGSYYAEVEVEGEYITRNFRVEANQKAELAMSPETETSAGEGEYAEGEGEYDGEGEYEGDYEGGEGEYEYTPEFQPAMNVEYTGDELVVLSPMETDAGLPGGLLHGDHIMTIDGQSAGEASMTGGKDSTMRVKVRRPATGQEFETTVPRTSEYIEEGGC